MKHPIEPKVAVGVLLSGGGRTFQNLLDRQRSGLLGIDIRCVVSDREDAFGVQRARRAGLPTYVTADGAKTFEILRKHGVELVLMAGYLRLLPIPDDYQGAVLNIHPALLPRFGGKGFYGERVHQAVLDAGDSTTGCTVHLCDQEYDRGEILLQKEVAVHPNDTRESLAARVFEAECEAYPEAIELWANTRRKRQSES